MNVVLSILSLRVALVFSEYAWTGEEWEWRELGGIERAPREFEGSGQVNLLHDDEDSMQSSLFLPDPQIETSGESITADDEDFNDKPKQKKPPSDKSRNRENENFIVERQSPRSGKKINLPSKDDEITFNHSDINADQSDQNISRRDANTTSRSHVNSKGSGLASSKILLLVFFFGFSIRFFKSFYT